MSLQQPLSRHGLAAEPSSEPLVRQLGALALWVLVINGMIGAGIFGLPAEAARLTGAYSPLMFVFCGLLVAMILMTLGEVASFFRGTGGPILYAQTAFGPLVGFQTGWVLYIARMTAFAANLNLVVNSLAYFWAGADHGALRVGLLLAACALLTGLNVVGTRHGVRSVAALTILKFFPLLLFVLIGLRFLHPSAFAAADTGLPGYLSFGEAALLVFYAFVGFEGGLVPAGEAKNPRRDMPRALFWALGIATLLYILVQAVCVAVLPDLAESRRPVVDAAAVLMGPIGAVLLTAGVMVSVGGNVAATMVTAPRMTYYLAREGSLPRWFGAVHPRFQTPHLSVLFFGALVFILAVYGSFIWLAAMSSLTRILVYLVCIGALPKLRRRFGEVPGSLRLPGGYLIPAAAVLVCLWLLMHVRASSVIVTGIALAAGGVFYAVARLGARRRAAPSGRG